MTRRKLLAAGPALLSLLVIPTLTAFGATAHSTSVAACSPEVRSSVLPVWMQAGFGRAARVTHAIGKRGAIGAVLWNKPLYSPPAQHVNNKILWVPRHVSKRVAPMWIKLQRMDGTQLVGAPLRRIITNGPGPSYVDAPSAGCWRLTITSSGQRDTLDLSYVPPTD
jgi:hypothetical protein